MLKEIDYMRKNEGKKEEQKRKRKKNGKQWKRESENGNL